MTQARDTGELVNDLGTASTVDVQTSPVDTTAGRALMVGTQELGAVNLIEENGLNLDNISTLGWKYVGSAVNGPMGYSTLKVFTIPSTIGGGRGSQFCYPVNLTDIWYRAQLSSSTWSAWQPIYTGANYQPESVSGIGVVKRMMNVSGSTINAGASVAGTSLNFIRTDTSGNATGSGGAIGTWMNTSAFNLGNNTIAEFVRTA